VPDGVGPCRDLRAHNLAPKTSCDVPRTAFRATARALERHADDATLSDNSRGECRRLQCVRSGERGCCRVHHARKLRAYTHTQRTSLSYVQQRTWRDGGARSHKRRPARAIRCVRRAHHHRRANLRTGLNTNVDVVAVVVVSGVVLTVVVAAAAYACMH
jgi:hypothetical protein